MPKPEIMLAGSDVTKEDFLEAHCGIIESTARDRCSNIDKLRATDPVQVAHLFLVAEMVAGGTMPEAIFDSISTIDELVGFINLRRRLVSGVASGT